MFREEHSLPFWGKVPLTLLLQNGAKLLKTDSWFQKSYEEFGKLQTSSGKSIKLKFNGLHLSKKYIPSAKILYAEDLSNITYNYLCKNSPNSLYNFETISHFSRPNSSVLFQLKHYIILTKIFHQSVNFQIFHCSS